MRIYSAVDEERIRAQARVREWAASGLLEASQGARLEEELRVDLRRTNGFLRAGLVLFTALIVIATVLLVMTVLGLREPRSMAAVNLVAGLVYFGIAELLAGRFRFYRFGVEEALAIAAVILVSTAGAECVTEPPYGAWGITARVVQLTIGSAGAFAVYRRFGFVYAAIGSMICAAAIPFQPHLSVTQQHLLSALTFTICFVAARWLRLRYRDDFPGDEYADLQAVALTGVYITLNLQLGWDAPSGGAFYWGTYAITWVLPLAGVGLALRDKDRELLAVSGIMALVTQVTNKPYLHWPRHTWDPMLLGVFLVAVALAARRWLSSGPDGERRGFTSARILHSERANLAILGAASAAFQPNISSSPASPSAPGFDGGRSGGAGGGATF